MVSRTDWWGNEACVLAFFTYATETLDKLDDINAVRISTEKEKRDEERERNSLVQVHMLKRVCL